MSIQSLILVDNPYFNEPGFEQGMHTDRGKAASRAYSANIMCVGLPVWTRHPGGNMYLCFAADTVAEQAVVQPAHMQCCAVAKSVGVG